MPGWHKRTLPLQKDGKIQLVGIIQEQHAQRCRLFMQWHQMDWPILVDSLNITGSKVVPRTFAIDEHGVVRLKVGRRTDIERDFLAKEWSAVAPSRTRPAPKKGSPDQLRHAADELFHWSGDGKLDAVIAGYEKVLSLDTGHAPTLFRLGVAHRRRFETVSRKPDDFQKAVDYWAAALNVDPNQYIWARRIQQFGPILSKPYPFYDWVDRATKEIVARGETPVKLRVPLTDSERVGRGKWNPAAAGQTANPDPKGRILRDKKSLVGLTVVAVPAVGRAGGDVRLHLSLEPRNERTAHWNNESTRLRIWIDPPRGVVPAACLLVHPNPKSATSQEPRHMEVDLRLNSGKPGQRYKVRGYALYNVCEDENGQCLFRRQDFEITVVAPKK